MLFEVYRLLIYLFYYLNTPFFPSSSLSISYIFITALNPFLYINIQFLIFICYPTFWKDPNQDIPKEEKWRSQIDFEALNLYEWKIFLWFHWLPMWKRKSTEVKFGGPAFNFQAKPRSVPIKQHQRHFFVIPLSSLPLANSLFPFPFFRFRISLDVRSFCTLRRRPPSISWVISVSSYRWGGLLLECSFLITNGTYQMPCLSVVFGCPIVLYSFLLFWIWLKSAQLAFFSEIPKNSPRSFGTSHSLSWSSRSNVIAYAISLPPIQKKQIFPAVCFRKSNHRCHLRKVFLEHVPSFAALSYRNGGIRFPPHLF